MPKKPLHRPLRRPQISPKRGAFLIFMGSCVLTRAIRVFMMYQSVLTANSSMLIGSVIGLVVILGWYFLRRKQGGAVPDVLIAHQRLVVGIGYSDITVCPQLQRRRGQFRRLKLPVPGHGNLVVLAEGTSQIAAEATYGQNHNCWDGTDAGVSSQWGPVPDWSACRSSAEESHHPGRPWHGRSRSDLRTGRNDGNTV